MAHKTLKQIVEEKDLKALEAFCLHYDYSSIIRIADGEGVDPDELEELLQEIS